MPQIVKHVRTRRRESTSCTWWVIMRVAVIIEVRSGKDPWGRKYGGIKMELEKAQKMLVKCWKDSEREKKICQWSSRKAHPFLVEEKMNRDVTLEAGNYLPKRKEDCGW